MPPNRTEPVGRRMVVGAARIAILVVVVMAGAFVPVGERQASAAKSTNNFPLVGQVILNNPQGSPININGGLIDAQIRRVVFWDSTRKLYLVDADTLEQTGILDVGFGAPSDFGTKMLAIDDIRHRVFVAGMTFPNETSASPEPRISVVPLEGGPPMVSMFGAVPRNTSAAERDAPRGFYRGTDVPAISYSATDDRLYVVTQVVASRVTGAPGLVTVHAFDAAKLASPTASDRAAAHLWAYPIDGCASVAGQPDRPGFVGYSPPGFVFFFCIGFQPGGVTSPLASSTASVAVRLDVDKAASPADTSQFELELFPVAAPLGVNGWAYGDAIGARLFVVAAAAGNQKLYVFDARHRAWTGNITLADTSISGLASDPTTGRIYVPQGGEPVVVTSADRLPVLQGDRVRLLTETGAVMSAKSGHPVYDPHTQRLFVSGDATSPGLFVYKDLVPVSVAAPPGDPDAGTNDVDEDPGTPVDFIGGGSALGVRASFVGGLRSAARGADVGNQIPDPQLKPESGDRSVILGRIEGAQLGDSTATATAVAVDVDEATETDIRSRSPDAAAMLGEVGELRPSICKDFGEGAQEAENAGSLAACDLENKRVLARAWSSSAMADLPMKVGSVTSQVVLERDEKLGFVSTVSAIARNVDIGVEGFGAIHIGEIRSTATSAAHGRPGTAGSTYATTMSQVSVIDAAGDEAFSCDVSDDGDVATATKGSCDPSEVARAINRAFPGRVAAQGPRRQTDPIVVASPGGAGHGADPIGRRVLVDGARWRHLLLR